MRQKKRHLTSAPPPVPSRIVLGLALLLGVLVACLYLPSLSSDFVYDAEAQIKYDTYLHNLDHLGDVLTLRVLSQDIIDGNRPVHLLFLMLDSLVWGLRPVGYHLTNILFHAGSTVLLALLIYHCLAKAFTDWRATLLPALTGALVFGLHTMQVEAVAEPSYREDLLATFFLLSGLLFAAHFPGTTARRSWILGSLSAFAFLLTVGSKETGFAGPPLLLAYWWLFRRKEKRREWYGLLGAVCGLVAAAAVALFGLHPAQSQFVIHPAHYIGGSFGMAIYLQPRIWAFQIVHLLWPTGLAADYDPSRMAFFTEPIALLIVGAFLTIQLLLSWKSRTAFFGTLLFWIGLAPVSNFIPLFRPVADRFLYLPMAGIALLLAAALACTRKYPVVQSTLLIVLAGGCIAMIPLDLQRQQAFSSSLALWKDTVLQTPQSVTANANLGYALIESGDADAAITYLKRSLELSHDRHEDSWTGLAVALELKKLPTQAEEAYRKAIALNPSLAKPLSFPMARFQNPSILAVQEQIASRLRAMPQ